MPIYEYQCENCSYRFELKQNFSDNPVATCPQCRRDAKRIFLSAPIIFKGPGFYITDKATEGKKKRFKDRRDGDRPADIEKKTGASEENKDRVVP